MSYEGQKTPFYQVFIGAANDSQDKLIPLPYQLHRLIEKIEIKEMFASGCIAGGQVSIIFREGSREPYFVDVPADTKEAYPIPGDGTVTNRTGMLADLNFIKSGGGVGITSILPSEAGIIFDDIPVEAIDALGDVAGSIGELASGSANEVVYIDNTTLSKKSPTYLFQNFNKMRVIWGYVEDPNSRRSVTFHINGIDIDYPEADQVTLTVMSVELGFNFDQVAGIFGISYSDKLPGLPTTTGSITTNVKDMTLKKLIEQFASSANMESIVSDVYETITIDDSAIRNIPAGMSPNQFFIELASRYDAVYKVFISNKTKKETIAFVAYKEYYSKFIVADPNILTYKAPGSIIKSVKLRAEYNANTGSAQVGVTKDGIVKGVATKKPLDVALVDADSSITDTDPTGSNPIGAAKGAAKALNTPTSVSTSEYQAGMDNETGSKYQTESKGHCQVKGMISLSMVTLGLPTLRPGAVKIGGLGKRYSNTYYIREVTHTIDAASGYVCTVEASNMGFDAGGAGGSGAGSSAVNIPTVDTALFTADGAAGALTGGNKGQELHEHLEGQ